MMNNITTFAHQKYNSAEKKMVNASDVHHVVMRDVKAKPICARGLLYSNLSINRGVCL